jgi:hypothetical protein
MPEMILPAANRRIIAGPGPVCQASGATVRGSPGLPGPALSNCGSKRLLPVCGHPRLAASTAQGRIAPPARVFNQQLSTSATDEVKGCDVVEMKLASPSIRCCRPRIGCARRMKLWLAAPLWRTMPAHGRRSSTIAARMT